MLKIFRKKEKLHVRSNKEYIKTELLEEYVDSELLHEYIDSDLLDEHVSYDLLKELFNKYKTNNNYIDESTYKDLDMDILFNKIDFTSTTPGRQELYRILRMPSYNKEELNKKEEVYKYFKENSEDRESINEELRKIGTNDESIFNMLEDAFINCDSMKIKYNLGSILLLFSAILLFFIRIKYSFLLLILAIIINLFIHTNKKSIGSLQSSKYICKMINSCEEIIKNTENSPFDAGNRLNILNEKLKDIVRKSAVINSFKSIPFIGVILSIFFFVEKRLCLEIDKDIFKFKSEIIELYELIGVLDSSLSVIDYRDSLSDYILPEFTCEKKHFNLVDVKHPLLEEAVGNNFKSKSNGLVITGSNMSGKSTFLRTLGINAITAQTINTVQAKEYKTSFFKVISSISIRDNIHASTSYYKGEADAIKRVIDNSNGDQTILSLIDEIFKGTNPVERISGAGEILNYIVKGNVYSIVTTHDINLLPLLDSYERYYFSETVENNKLKFDYKMKQGTSPSGNAVKILDIMGYPKTIINKIYKTIDVISKEEVS